jgi:hypothetical protein
LKSLLSKEVRKKKNNLLKAGFFVFSHLPDRDHRPEGGNPQTRITSTASNSQNAIQSPDFWHYFWSMQQVFHENTMESFSK